MTLYDLISDLLNIPEDQLADTLTIKEVDRWDSLTHMDLVAKLEEVYSIELTIEEITEMISIAAIKKILQQKGIQHN